MEASHFYRPFPSCFEPHYESEQKCKVFIMKISFHSYAKKTHMLHMKSFALSLAFITRFTATRKWLIRDIFRVAQSGKECRFSFSSASLENRLTKLNEAKNSKQILEIQGFSAQADHDTTKCVPIHEVPTWLETSQ